jgi:hypothetical protein
MWQQDSPAAAVAGESDSKELHQVFATVQLTIYSTLDLALSYYLSSLKMLLLTCSFSLEYLLFLLYLPIY